MKKILTCIGTRPNIVKITQLGNYLSAENGLVHEVLHTGQHFDHNMSAIFFEEFGLKAPDFALNAVTANSSNNTNEIQERFEQFISSYTPDLIIVPGDVNSSYACALVASQKGIPIAHIESGLRSFDQSMPEERNRIAIDQMADLCFVTEESGIANLKETGKNDDAICFVGNTMIDTLITYKDQIESSTILEKHDLANTQYAVLTFHRPINVDQESQLAQVCELINQIARLFKVAFPIHPRTLKNLRKFGLLERIENSNIKILEPLGYFDFMKLVSKSSVVVTDSGGIQEETTFLQVPCLTVRPNTERPITITEGTNELVDLDSPQIIDQVNRILSGKYKKGIIPKYWDGKASKRIAERLIAYLQK